MAESPAPEHLPPPGADDATVEAVGRLTEALETIERACGSLLPPGAVLVVSCLVTSVWAPD